VQVRRIEKTLLFLAMASIGTLGFALAASAASTLEVTLNGSSVTTMQAGDEIDVSTGSQIPIDGASSHTLGLSWSGQSLQLEDLSSITQPQGWVLEYSIDGTTWSRTPPSDPKTIVAVRSLGDLSSNDGNTLFQGSTTGTLIATQTSFQGSSGGDGYDLTFAGDRVFNVFHHNATQIQLDCHVKSTGASCFGVVKNFPGYATSNTSSTFWHAGTSKLYVMSKRISDNTFGFACIDFASTNNPVLCSTPFYSLDDGVATTNSLHGASRSGDIVYLLDSSDYNLLCLNIATATPCADNQTTLPGTSNASDYGRITADGSKIYYNTYDRFGCWDTVTNANCGGTNPQTIAANHQHPPFPVRDSSGTLLGYCTYRTALCVTDTNTLFTMPSGLLSFVTGTTLPDWNYFGAGQWAEADNRLYLNKGPSTTATANVYCHDFDTNAACAGFAGTNVGTRIYTIHKDPSIPNCMWTNGDAGQITTFNGTTGVSGCSTSYPIVEMPLNAAATRMSCDGVGRVLSWDNITFTIPAGISSSAVRVTVLDTSGSPITGWTDLSITSGGVLDISSLSVSQSGTSPTIQVQAGSVDGALLDDITGVVKFESSAPELCLVLKAAQVCPSVTPDPTDTSVPNGLIQSIAVTTPSAGNSVGSEFNATIAGTNTGSLCAPTIALMSITRQSASVPTSASPSLLLATTGANPIVGAVIFGSAATLAISGSLLLWKRRRLSN
jgi:hypothetical protein